MEKGEFSKLYQVGLGWVMEENKKVYCKVVVQHFELKVIDFFYLSLDKKFSYL